MARTMLGSVDLDEHNLDAAEDHFRTALNLEPSFAAAHEHLAIVLRQRGNLQGAIKEYHRAAVLRPDLSGVESGLADALMAAGRPQEALRSYRQIQQHESRPSAALLAAMARAEGQIGRTQVAAGPAKRRIPPFARSVT